VTVPRASVMVPRASVMVLKPVLLTRKPLFEHSTPTSASSNESVHCDSPGATKTRSPESGSRTFARASFCGGRAPKSAGDSTSSDGARRALGGREPAIDGNV
jgi:hypothetical protein